MNTCIFLKIPTFLKKFLSKADLEYEICFPYTIETLTNLSSLVHNNPCLVIYRILFDIFSDELLTNTRVLFKN